MRSLLLSALCATLCTGALLSAQNQVMHVDGTAEATSRGVAGVAPKTLLQRLPENQIAGRTALVSVTLTLQDQAIATPEVFGVEVRGNAPFGPPTGSPDMTPAGLIAAAGPFPIVFPGPGPVSAVVLTIVFAAPVILPVAPGVMGDIYVGVVLPPSPAWPADGISVQCSGAFFAPPAAGEQMRAGALGYGGVFGAAGLAWDYNAATGVLGVAGANRAWLIGADLVDNVCQPFADNPAVFTGILYAAGVPGSGTGMSPNFGYAGIFPDLARGDGIGWRARAATLPGSLAFLFVSPLRMPLPVPVPGIAGSLVLAPGAMFMLAAGFTVASPGLPPGSSEVVFGPLFPPPGLAGDVFAQVLTVDPAFVGVSLSTMSRTNF